MLTVHRPAAIQAAMATKPEVALVALVQYWQERIEAAEQEGKKLFAWLLEQPQQDLLELLAFCTVNSINTVSGRRNTPPNEARRS